MQEHDNRANMKFINIRELLKSPSKYIKSAYEEGDVIVTRNGKPYAVISKIDGDEVEDLVLAKHSDFEKQFKRVIKAMKRSTFVFCSNKSKVTPQMTFKV